MKQRLLKSTLLWLVLLLSVAVQAQFTVNGTIQDEDGEPLIGVSVIVRGTTIGTISDFDGNFKLDIPGQSAMLEYSYIGYATVTQEVSGDSKNITVVLADAATSLDEVVVTGLATSLKRSNIANSVAQIDAKDLTGVTTQQTMDGALYGKFTGVNISSNSGAPGGGISVKLRGITSLTSNSQPLFIIDGVYVDNSAIKAGFDVVSKSQAGGSTNIQDDPSNRIADIDPEDIETIEILKGASAAAIYGSRAGAGVVIITTKRGKSGKTSVDFSQSIGANMLLRSLGQREWNDERVMSAFGANAVADYQAAKAAGKLYDYEEELYGNNGLSSTSRLSISGGDDKTRFYAGITYKDEEGIVENTGYERTNFRLNIDRKVWDWLDLGLSSNYVQTSADRGYFNNDNTSTTLGVSFVSTPAWADLFPDENGNYPNNPFTAANFLQTAAQVTNNESVDRVITGGTATVRLFNTDNQSLRLLVRGGFDYYTLQTTAIFPRTLQFQKDGNGTDGAAIIGNTTNLNSNMAAFLVHSFFTEGGLNFRTQVGVTAENFDQNTVRNTAQFLVGTQTNLDQASSIQVEQHKIIQKDRGFFAQEEINWQDKLIATVGVRGDKSSNNGDPNKLFFYPKASLALNLHEFGIMGEGFLNQLKLRVAYGQSGNFGKFGALYTALTPTVIGGSTGSLIGTTRGKEDLGPERQTEIETGFDLGLMNNKLLVDFTYYIKNIDDLILDVDVPTSSGFAKRWQNVGEIGNKGIEIGLSLTPVRSRNFNWNSRLAFWLNRAEVLRLDVPRYFTGGFGATLGTYRIEEGKSPTQLVGIAAAGDDDPDGDGIAVFGNGEPDFQMSFNNALNYRNFELSFLFHWKKGGDNINLSTLLSDIFGTSPDYDDEDLDPSGQLSNGAYRLNALGSTASPWIEDASYIRLREIGLSYRIPKEKLGDVCSLKIGVSGRNLLNFFDYNSYDPEVSNFGANAISSAVEVTPFPSAKSIFFNLSASF